MINVKNKMVFESLYKNDIIELLQSMIRINTVNPPGNEERLGVLLKNKFKELGLESKIDILDKNRGNIVCKIAGNGKKGALLFNGHLDTVPTGEAKWDYDPFSGEIVNNHIYGRGSSDMKGGIASIIIAIKAILDEGIELQGDLIFAGTAGEETDSLGAYDFIHKGGLKGIDAIVIGEPTSCKIAIAEKGALWFEVTVFGKTAHGAFPDKGINAIKLMCIFLNKLMDYEFKYTPHDLLNLPTMNVATIHGGIKTNVVPDICKVNIDIRTLPSIKHQDIIEDLENIIIDIKKNIPEFNAEIKVINDRTAVETKHNHPFIELGQSIIKEYMQKDISPIGVSYYTDAAVFLSNSDLPCIIYGPGASDMAHKPNEMVSIEDLVEAAYFYYLIIEKQLVLPKSFGA